MDTNWYELAWTGLSAIGARNHAVWWWRTKRDRRIMRDLGLEPPDERARFTLDLMEWIERDRTILKSGLSLIGVVSTFTGDKPVDAGSFVIIAMLFGILVYLTITSWRTQRKRERLFRVITDEAGMTEEVERRRGHH